MSVWVSAILSHNWEFSKNAIQKISFAISSCSAPIKWLQHESLKSPEEEFESEGTVSFFLPNDFHVWFGKKIVGLEHTDRWYRFLTNAQSRQDFLSAGKSVANLVGAKEILFLPEGTVLMDLYYDGKDFEDCKRKADLIWGAPNLDIAHIYTTHEINENLGKRVDYFLVNID